MSEFLRNGPIARAVCRSPSAQGAHDGPENELVVEKVWCVAVQNGRSDHSGRAAATGSVQPKWDVWQRRG